MHVYSRFVPLILPRMRFADVRSIELRLAELQAAEEEIKARLMLQDRPLPVAAAAPGERAPYPPYGDYGYQGGLGSSAAYPEIEPSESPGAVAAPPPPRSGGNKIPEPNFNPDADAPFGTDRNAKVSALF